MPEPIAKPHLPPLRIESGVIKSPGLFGDPVVTGCRNGNPEHCVAETERGVPVKLRLVCVPISKDGYAPNRSYYGIGLPVYHAESTEDFDLVPWTGGETYRGHIRLFRRASTREDAKTEIRKMLPNAKFYR